MLAIKWILWVVTVYSLPLHCTARCLFGTYDDCAFKCHCTKVTECNSQEVTCPGGCAPDILGYKWSGPACQIGNLAYRKQAKTHGDVSVVTADISKAVDGQLQPSCASIAFTTGTLAQWSLDLGDNYRIINIIIHFSKESCCGIDRLRNHFTIRVSSSSPGPGTGVVCVVANGNTLPPITYNISCPDGTTGRYVYFSRLSGGYLPQQLALCEMIVNGYRPIDCSSCPSGVACTDVTGCKTCSGSYQPECKQACVRGYYGTNCQQKCGKCTTGTACNGITGICPSGCNQWWLPDLCQTYIDRPKPTNKTSTILTISRTSVDLAWVQITVNDDIAKYYGYEIRHKISSDNNFVDKVTSVAHRFGLLINNVTIRHLMANTWYEIVIYPYREWKGNKDYGMPYNTLKGRTKCTEPDKPKLTSVISVPIIVGSRDKVDVIFQDVESLYSGCDQLTDAWIQYKLEGRNKEQSKKLNLKSQTASFEPQYGGTYLVWLTVENNDGLTSSSDVWNITVNGPTAPEVNEQSSSKGTPVVRPVTVIIASVVGVICFIILIITIIGCLRRRRKRLNKGESKAVHRKTERGADWEEEMIDVKGQVIGTLPRLPPRRKKLQATGASVVSNGVYQNMELEPIKDVNIEDFEDYVNRRMNTDQFVEEYASLPAADNERCLTALSESNIKCNRYRKVYPYDDTRVVLQTDNVSQREYINASYITGYTQSKEYIATQGPFDTTVVDFWRMVWQEGSNRIVMVANVEENGKIRCSQYWPPETGHSVTYGPFTLTTEYVDVTVDYTTSKITVKKNDDIRTVYHFHFTSWADKNKPVYGAMTLIAFFRKVHSFDELAEGPLVVHCSAGIGRTGTFIALDILQKQAIHEGKLNVYSCVKKLRDQRMLMVHLEAQYVFMHKFLAEVIKSGFTSYEAEGFTYKYKLLCDPEPALAGLSRLDRQFQILCEMKEEFDESRPKDGLLAENRQKNRDLDVVPSNEDRLHLPGKVKDDYINAIYVDSFKVHDFYVVTQMPLPDTVIDFWRLVYRLKTRSIIMLNQFDNSDSTSKPYWPSKEMPKQTYGPIEVTLVKTNDGNNFDCICTRDFMIRTRNSKRAEGRTVRQFQLLTWPNSSRIPPNNEDILKLIDLTEHWQRQFRIRRAGNTIVHCLNGGKQSGVFCGATFVLDKMKSEQQIDAFLAVRYVTRRRPQYFQSKDEFKFLHEIAIAAMERIKVYGNTQ